MLMRVTGKDRNTFWIRADQVCWIERSPENPLETLIRMQIITPQGFLTHIVLDNPDDLAQMINAVSRMKDLH